MHKWKQLIIIFSLSIGSNNITARPILFDQVVAIVNNSVVLESEVNNLCTIINTSLQQVGKPPLLNNSIMRRTILDQLIMKNIILQLAQRNNITVSNQQIDQIIQLLASAHHMDINHFIQQQHKINPDLNYDNYRTKISQEWLISAVSNSEISRRITIFPQEVNYLAKQIAAQIRINQTKFNISYILIPLPEKYSKSQLNKAEELANYLMSKSKQGVKYNTILNTYSSCSIYSGQFKWRTLKELPTLFAPYVQHASQGSIIGPIRSAMGLFILKVNDIRSENQQAVVTELHTRHICLHTSLSMNDQQARNKLTDITQQINNGWISFSNAAQQLSDDLISAPLGGDLGWQATDSLDPIFLPVLTNLHKGEISSPVRSWYGWHLIQLLEIRQLNRNDALLKKQAYQLLVNRKFAEEAQYWFQEQHNLVYSKIVNNDQY